MPAGNLHTSQLDEFVQTFDALGGPNHPNTSEYLSEFSITHDTKIDESLDPFSEEYYQSQLALYREISGRSLDQESGEMTAIDVELHSQGVNPYNSGDINFVAKNARAILTMLYMANIPGHGKVLDLGCGWGMSSEVMAFCGAQVTCVDINPLFVELNRKRASRLNLPLNSKLSNFDDYQDDQTYDLVVFYECLHHSVKPWETLQHIAQFINPQGKIAFAGEPINTTYWKHWGIRLDPLSIYCIRKFGWFESGWSPTFLTQAFQKAGFKLEIYPNVGLDAGEIGIAFKQDNNAKPEESLNLNVLPPKVNVTARDVAKSVVRAPRKILRKGKSKVKSLLN